MNRRKDGHLAKARTTPLRASPARSSRVGPAPSRPVAPAAPVSPPECCRDDETPGSTRERLLEAAGHVFAEVGLKDATVRDICTRAGANIAAINYHFQGKEALYLHVVDYAQARVQRSSPIAIDPAAPAPQRLHQFLRAYIGRVLDPCAPSWHAKLMLREMIEPTGALDRVVENMIRPTFHALSQILHELAPGLSDEQLRLCSTSIIGQCLVHRHCEPVLARLFPCCDRSPAALDALAEHVLRFSLGGLKAAAAQKPVASRPGKEGRS